MDAALTAWEWTEELAKNQTVVCMHNHQDLVLYIKFILGQNAFLIANITLFPALTQKKYVFFLTHLKNLET